MRTTTTHELPLPELIHKLDAAVRIGEVQRTTARIKSELEDFCARPDHALPSRFCECRPDGYARRLLHRDPDLGYTVVVMTWGPGQGTELHDHAGIWCVECVVQGELLVTQYDAVEQDGDRFRFEKRQQLRAGVGTAGCLIPPFEYHTLTNALPDRATVTLHVYGGEMSFCNLYRPDDAGWWQQIAKDLGYAS